MSTSDLSNPFQVLGVSKEAGETEIRARYLELVKRFPPDREPDKFREIQAAYQAAKDPLLIAQRLLEPPSEDPPQWSDAIEEQKKNPPAISPAFVLSLGNLDQRLRFDQRHGTEGAIENESVDNESVDGMSIDGKGQATSERATSERATSEQADNNTV